MEVNSEQEFIPIDGSPRLRVAVNQPTRMEIDEIDARDNSSSESVPDGEYINADPELAYEPQGWRFIGGNNQNEPELPI